MEIMYDRPDATIERLHPGFEVTLKGSARQAVGPGLRKRRFASKTEAVRWVLACRTIARECPA